MNKEQVFVEMQSKGTLEFEIRPLTKFLLLYLYKFYAPIHSDRIGTKASIRWYFFGLFKRFVRFLDKEANEIFEFAVEHRREIKNLAFLLMKIIRLLSDLKEPRELSFLQFLLGKTLN